MRSSHELSEVDFVVITTKLPTPFCDVKEMKEFSNEWKNFYSIE